MFSCCCPEKQPSTSTELLGPNKDSEPQQNEVERISDTKTASENADLLSTKASATAKEVFLAAAGAAIDKYQGANRAPIKSGGVFRPPVKEQVAPALIPLTFVAADTARRTSVPTEASLAAGAYLMYDAETGTLYCQWSLIPQENALAWLKPAVQVPGHKYNVNKGKQVLARDCKTPEKYFKGWVGFLTLLRDFPGKLMLLNNFEAAGAPPVKLYILETPVDRPGETVAKEVKEYQKLYDFLKNVKAAAVVPDESTLLKDEEVIDGKVFLQRGNGVGAAVVLSAGRAFT